MPDADRGDEFLRHRGAILDALLSDPYFEYLDAEPAGNIPSVAAPAGTPAPGADDFLFEAPAAGIGDEVVPPVDEPADRAPRRSSAGPSASERINALLSGQTAGPGQEFGPDYAQAAADRINRDARDRQEAAEDTASASVPPPAEQRSAPQQIVQDVTTQLRRPRVALAVGAVVAVLILILLIFTGGESPEETRPLAVTPAPTGTAPPVTEVPETGGTIEVEGAEAQCPPGSTEGMDAFSGEPDKAWSCVQAYKVDGQILRIDLGKEYKVDSIGIVPGWDHIGSDGTDQWTKFRTVSRVSYDFDDDDKTRYTQETLDQRSLVVTKIEPPIAASEIVLTVLKSGGESGADAVAISSIVITGH